MAGKEQSRSVVGVARFADPAVVGGGALACDEAAPRVRSRRRERGKIEFVGEMERLLTAESGDAAWARHFARYAASVIARRAGKEAAADMIFRNLPSAQTNIR